MTKHQLADNLARATVYRLLSACYYQPERVFVDEDVFGQLREALAVLDDALADRAEALGQAFRVGPLDELLLDYSRLFLGPFHILAKPYGSIYLDGEKVTMGDSTLNALACYREGQFELAEDFHEVPDHVAVELEFLYLLTFREHAALANGHASDYDVAALQKATFLQNHLGRWIKPFCGCLRHGAGTEFYRILADLTEEFIAGENSRGVVRAA